MPDTTPRAERYDPQSVEAKWQRRWEERRTNAVDLADADRPYFNLMMFPYPSAEGLHVGNVFAFVGSDVHGRFRRHHSGRAERLTEDAGNAVQVHSHPPYSRRPRRREYGG